MWTLGKTYIYAYIPRYRYAHACVRIYVIAILWLKPKNGLDEIKPTFFVFSRYIVFNLSSGPQALALTHTNNDILCVVWVYIFSLNAFAIMTVALVWRDTHCIATSQFISKRY